MADFIGFFPMLVVILILLALKMHEVQMLKELPGTNRREMHKINERILELEWELNIGNVRKWSVWRRWDGRWVASGPSYRWRGDSDILIFDTWSDAMFEAFTSAKRCADNPLPEKFCL